MKPSMHSTSRIFKENPMSNPKNVPVSKADLYVLLQPYIIIVIPSLFYLYELPVQSLSGFYRCYVRLLHGRRHPATA